MIERKRMGYMAERLVLERTRWHLAKATQLSGFRLQFSV